MNDPSVLLAALGIVATAVGYLIKQNNTAMVKLSNVLDRLSDRIEKSETRGLEFQETVLKYLKEIDEKADRNFEAVTTQKIRTQQVDKQIVNHEVVRSTK